jgi:hypothetical protein
VHDDDPSVPGGAHVELQEVRAALQRRAQGVHRVAGQLVLPALMGHVHHAGVEPAVAGAGLGGQREQAGQGEEQQGRAGHASSR